MKKIGIFLIIAVFSVIHISPSPADSDKKAADTAMKLRVQIKGVSFTVAPANTAAAAEFVEMARQAPVTITMRDYGGFEKVGSLGKTLTADDRQTTTSPGDVVLYRGNQIVMFYGSNSWSYTKLGRVEDLTGWADCLGNGSITATFFAEE